MLQDKQTPTKGRIAFINGSRIGDTIVDLTFINYLSASGFTVTLYNKVLASLSPILPVDIKSFTCLNSIANELNNNYDLILMSWERSHMLEICNDPRLTQAKNKTMIIGYPDHKNYLIEHNIKFSKPIIDKQNKTLALLTDHWDAVEYLPQHCTNFFSGIDLIATKILKLQQVKRQIAYRFPSDWNYRQHEKRVVICPSSATANKSWSPKKFARLASKLHELNYQTLFVVNQQELVFYQKCLSGQNIFSGTLLEVTNKIYHSGFYIGNDSGIGHLASSLGIPTLTIFVKKAAAVDLWRPRLSNSHIIKPLINGWTAKHHRRCLISVANVIKQFISFSNSLNHIKKES